MSSLVSATAHEGYSHCGWCHINYMSPDTNIQQRFTLNFLLDMLWAYAYK